MISVQRSDIPEYLRNGGFYRSLVENEADPDEKLSFPASVLKSDVTVRCVEDCDHLLNSLRYWGVADHLPTALIDFVLSAPSFEYFYILQEYESEFDCLRPLQRMAAAPLHRRMEIAIASGKIELVKGATRRSDIFPTNACDLAAETGRLEVMIFLRACGCVFSNTTLQVAAQHGQVTTLEYLRKQRCLIRLRHLAAAAEGGHVECVKYMLPYLSRIAAKPILVNTASLHGHVNLLQYLDACHFDWRRHSCLHAARGGNLECLKFMHERGSNWSADIIAFAAQNGHFDCLKYMHEHGCPWDQQTCYCAAIGGHLACLQYAHEHGCPLGTISFHWSGFNPCKAYVAHHTAG